MEKKGIIITKDNLLFYLKKAKKRLLDNGGSSLGIGICDWCGRTAFFWIENNKLCEECVYKKYETKINRPAEKRAKEESVREEGKGKIKEKRRV